MSAQQIVFIIVALVTVGSALVVVSGRNLFHAALAMMLSFAGVAGLYVLLEAGFVAASQLLIYIGAISILILFAIMMTRRMMQTSESPFNSQALWGGAAAALLFLLLAGVIRIIWGDVALAAGSSFNFLAGPTPVPAEVIDGMVVELGRLFVSPEWYVIPFEVISLLLLAALIGSIFIARPDDEK